MEYLIAADAPAESADAICSSQFKNRSDAEKVGGTSQKEQYNHAETFSAFPHLNCR
jgi:hypothetical protein